jgi:hypothetical protein
MLPSELLQELGAISAFLEHDEQGVVSADGAQDIGDLQEVDAIRNARRMAHLGLHDGEVARKLDAHDLAPEVVAGSVGGSTV